MTKTFWKNFYFRGISSYSTTQTLDSVYIIGGYVTQNTGIVAEFNDNQWRQLDNLNQPRAEHGSITVGDQTMIIGGFYTDGEYVFI